MKIESPEQLETLVKLCRKLGVSNIEVDGIKLNLKDAPKRKRKGTETTEPLSEELTEEQLLYWSVNNA